MSGLSAFSVVGFSGRRVCSPSVVSLVSRVVAGLGRGVPVWVGCASGVDAAARAACSGSGRVVRVFAAEGRRSSALVARSVAFVRALAAAGGCLVSFPGVACPAGVVPGSVWPSGFGSGSWASAALAVGLGVPVFVWLPSLVAPPAWLRPLVGFPGWFVARETNSVTNRKQEV